MTDTMLFRAAKAAALADTPDASYADIVRAALEAIRVPDPHLHEIGRDAGAMMVGGRIVAVSPDAAFTAIIDAILSEDQTNG